MAAATRHVYPEAATARGGRLAIGGCDAVELAREFGTPAYVVAEDDLRGAARAYRDALARHHGPRGEVVFAAKAFPCTAVLRVFAEEGLGADVASAGELAMALRAGLAPERIVVHGNAKSRGELEATLALRTATLVVDNHDEIDRLAALADPAGAQPVLLRVTPGVETDTHAAIATGHARSKFGLPVERARRALARLAEMEGIALGGLHVHLGSQLLDPSPYHEAMAALAALGRFDAYDLGGGLGVPYLPGQATPSADAWVAAVVGAAHAALGAHGAHLRLEPGRALVAAAGVTLYTVESVKRGAPTWVAVDGGMSDNLRPMLYGAPYHAEVADRLGTEHDPGEPCELAGKHCESGDVLAHGVRLRDPRPGDVVVTPVTGAYGHAMANNYNGVCRPPVIFCSGGDARVVVRRETVEDLLARDL
jgi:diaminopimelate decarboxylase